MSELNDKLSDSLIESEELKKNGNSKRTKQHSSNKLKKVKYEDVTDRNNRPNKKDLYRPPTVEELSSLTETETLYNSNLFRLQIQELVSEINIKNKTKTQWATWKEQFKMFLDSLPSCDVLNIVDCNIGLEKKPTNEEKVIQLHFDKLYIGIKHEEDLTLNIYKPESFNVFGLFENNALPGPNLTAHINIKMPKKYFHAKDYLNYRYFLKRYYYLKYISQHLQSSSLVDTMRFDLHVGNPLLPIITVRPKCSKHIWVKIHVTPVDECFKYSRLLPDINNVKLDLFDAFRDEDILKNSPTVYYNSSLAHDISLSLNSDNLSLILSEHENIQEGIRLIIVWLQQRELNKGAGSFKKYLVLYFVAYLLNKKKINKHMSSYLIVRNFWNFIARGNLEDNPISLTHVDETIMTSFKKHFDIVFIDQTGFFNITSFLSAEMFESVKRECELALKLLDENKCDSFQLLFLSKMPFCLQYDLLIDLTESLPLKDDLLEVDETEKTKYVGCTYLSYTNYLTSVLKRGFGKRILSIVPKIAIDYNFIKGDLKKIVYGINLNPDEAFNFIEMGPTLDDHIEADEFRKFWGHLSSDRRFRDGSAHVAVYFKTNTIKGKRCIIKKIINYLLTEKLQLKYRLFYDQLEDVIENKKIVPPYPLGTNEEGSLKVIAAYDDLGKKIRSLKMSLSITGITSSSNILSYTEVFPPIATNYELGDLTAAKGNNIVFGKKKAGLVPRYIQPIECILQMEHSSKWPNHLKAVECIKTSFYLEMAKMLQENHGITCHVTTNYMDVLYEGFVFRYKLNVPKEIALLKQDINESGMIYYKKSLESFIMEMDMNILPKINASLKGLQSQYPSFGPGTAIIKRWLSSQLIDNSHFPDVVVNLINASLYLTGSGFHHPTTPHMSFLRFLKFFTEFQWNVQPVIVNFNGELTKDIICEIECKLQENRNAYYPLYIILPYDQGQSLVTKFSPNEHILTRVQQLAKATLEYSNKCVDNGVCLNIKDIFTPNLTGYNVLIHLKPLMNPRKHEDINSAEFGSKLVLDKYNPNESKLIPIVDFNPVDKYLRILRESYGELAYFFNDTYGGNVIGVIWKPETLMEKEFKVTNVNGRKFINDKLMLNFDAILEDFNILGRGIVKSIESVDT